jgi:hypothetical protein
MIAGMTQNKVARIGRRYPRVPAVRPADAPAGVLARVLVALRRFVRL